MATRKLTLRGIVHWSSLNPDFPDMGWQDAWKDTEGKFTCTLEIDEEEEKKLKDSGSVLRPNSNDTTFGVKYRFTRKNKDPVGEWASGCPQVSMKDGSPVEGYIVKGSSVEVDISVFDTKGYPGTRLEAVRVLQMVEKEEAA